MTKIFYETHGAENGQSIVFLHGGGAAGWMWREQVRAFSPHYHVLTPDLPGQGQSAGAGPYSTERAADLVAELIREQARGGRAHVVGLSEGAQVTVALLARAPEVVERAVVSSALLLPMPGNWLYTRGLMAWSHRWFIQPFKNNEGWIHLNMKYSAGIPEAYYAEFKRSFQEASEDGTADMLYEGMHFRLPAGLGKAGAPTLVVVGRHEYKQMQQSARGLVAALPRARGGMISLGPESSLRALRALRAEHNWAMTAPEFFNATVRAWIEEGALPEELLPLA